MSDPSKELTLEERAMAEFDLCHPSPPLSATQGVPERIEDVFRYLLKVGYNWGRSSRHFDEPYQDEFGEKFDFDSLREPEKLIIQSMISKAPTAAPDAWQGIESAPKDGTPVLLGCFDEGNDW